MPSNIIPQRVPMVDPKTGQVSREWYNFFITLFDLTGGGQNSMTLTDLQQMPPVIPSTGWTPPVGMVAFFPEISTPPAGWVEYTPLRGRFPRGMPSGGTPGATGGSTTTSAPQGSDSNYVLNATGATTTSAPTLGHTHTVTPPYVDGMWCKYTG